MRATSDVGGFATRDAEEHDEASATRRAGLEDSWFERPRPASHPPARRSSAPPPSLDDDVADAWFR